MSNTPVTERLQQLQAWRGPRRKAASMGETVASLQRSAEKAHQQLGSFVEAWDELLPEELSSKTSVEARRGGVVHVRARSASVAWELDRRLREGLLGELRSRCSGAISRVQVRVGGQVPHDAVRRPRTA